MNQAQIDKLKENIKATPFKDFQGNIVMTYGKIHSDMSKLRNSTFSSTWFVADTIDLNCVIKTAQMLIADVNTETCEVVNIMTEAEYEMHIDAAFDKETEPATLFTGPIPNFNGVLEYFYGC